MLQLHQTFQFQLQASEAGGELNQLPNTAVNWEVVGGVGTISSHGLFTSTSPGSGTVKATLKSNPSLVQTTSVSVAGASGGTYQAEIPLKAGINIFSLPLKPDELIFKLIL